MARVNHTYESNYFFGIGILNNVNELNIGTLWRSAYILGASFIFTVDKKYKQQGSDVTRTWTKIPLYHYNTIHELKSNLPYSTRLIGVEMTNNSIPLSQFEHPERAVYLLGNEQIGLSENVMKECHSIISLPGNFSLNVAVTGSILMYDRVTKLQTVFPKGTN
ncbi:MAG: RNA methyltransferase [gamma proteobacterium symbiont of Taylorina sp.]|nr:RNA methyltransferase [gamma proteobacterium symbiont of Taylorina sp.]